MKLPSETVIAPEKLTRYLLVKRTIWMNEFRGGVTKFITLYPEKGRLP